MAVSASPRSDTSLLTQRLPEGWSAPESVEDVIVADGLSIRRAGVASVSPDGEEVTGSAAELESSAMHAGEVPPASKAWFELLERASIVEAMLASSARYELRTAAGSHVGTCSRLELFPESDDPTTWRHARSNGVAIHRDWSSACDRALWELAERDRVLASWHGHVRPELVAGAPLAVGDATRCYEWSAWAFPEERAGSFSHGIEVVGVFGFPIRPDAPLVLGFAARPDRRSALDDATREAIQLLGFLWGEPVADASTPVSPTAMGHLDFHQARERHSQLRSWLDGGHLRYASSDPFRGARAGDGAIGSESVVFADLTPAWLGGGMRVAKAVCGAARPLVFGESPFAAHLPKEHRIHPIS
jgi:YcaO cyclodehydratase, ATP-ad Mg2+-binding